MIEDIMKTIGFKEEETKTYLSLMDLGTSSGGDLSTKTGIARATIYGYLDRLVAGGLASQSIQHGKKIFTAESGEKIRLIYKRKIDELKSKEQALATIMPELEKRAGMSLFRPKMQFFEGRDGMETALQDFLSYEGVHIHAFWSIKAAIEATSEDFFWYINKERLKKNIYIDAIWPERQAISIKRYPALGAGHEFRREIRIAPEGVESSMGYWAYANKVLFSSSRKESFCFIIESTELYEMMVNHHLVIWKISKPLKPKSKDMKPFLDDFYK